MHHNRNIALWRPATILAVVAALTLVAAPAPADNHVTGLRADVISDLDRVSGQIADLAEAMPADKFSWRPADGIRSVSEAYMHVAGANYFFAGRLGHAAPEGVDPQNLESITDKAKVIETLKASFDHVKAAIEAVDDSSMEETMSLGQFNPSKRRFLLIISGHAHEHLGQQIAYARSNGVAPPWSQ